MPATDYGIVESDAQQVQVTSAWLIRCIPGSEESILFRSDENVAILTELEFDQQQVETYSATWLEQYHPGSVESILFRSDENVAILTELEFDQQQRSVEAVPWLDSGMATLEPSIDMAQAQGSEPFIDLVRTTPVTGAVEVGVGSPIILYVADRIAKREVPVELIAANEYTSTPTPAHGVADLKTTIRVKIGEGTWATIYSSGSAQGGWTVAAQTDLLYQGYKYTLTPPTPFPPNTPIVFGVDMEDQDRNFAHDETYGFTTAKAVSATDYGVVEVDFQQQTEYTAPWLLAQGPNAEESIFYRIDEIIDNLVESEFDQQQLEVYTAPWLENCLPGSIESTLFRIDEIIDNLVESEFDQQQQGQEVPPWVPLFDTFELITATAPVQLSEPFVDYTRTLPVSGAANVQTDSTIVLYVADKIAKRESHIELVAADIYSYTPEPARGIADLKTVIRVKYGSGAWVTIYSNGAAQSGWTVDKQVDQFYQGYKYTLTPGAAFPNLTSVLFAITMEDQDHNFACDESYGFTTVRYIPATDYGVVELDACQGTESQPWLMVCTPGSEQPIFHEITSDLLPAQFDHQQQQQEVPLWAPQFESFEVASIVAPAQGSEPFIDYTRTWPQTGTLDVQPSSSIVLYVADRIAKRETHVLLVEADEFASTPEPARGIADLKTVIRVKYGSGTWTTVYFSGSAQNGWTVDKQTDLLYKGYKYILTPPVAFPDFTQIRFGVSAEDQDRNFSYDETYNFSTTESFTYGSCSLGMEMTTVYIKTGDKEPLQAMVVDTDGIPTIGLIDVKAKIRRLSDGLYYDWTDNRFKAGVSVAKLMEALSEVSSIYFKGEYILNTVDHPMGWDTAKIANVNADDVYHVTVDQDGARTAGNLPQIGEIKAGRWVDMLNAQVSTRATPDDVETRATTVIRDFGLDHLVSVNPGIVPPAANTYIRQILDKENQILAGSNSCNVKQSFAYDPALDLITGQLWVEKNNRVNDDTISMTMSWYDEDGNFVFSAAGVPDLQGVYKVSKTTPGLVRNRSYYTVVTANLPEIGTVTSAKGTFTVG